MPELPTRTQRGRGVVGNFRRAMLTQGCRLQNSDVLSAISRHCLNCLEMGGGNHCAIVEVGNFRRAMLTHGCRLQNSDVLSTISRQCLNCLKMGGGNHCAIVGCHAGSIHRGPNRLSFDKLPKEGTNDERGRS